MLGGRTSSLADRDPAVAAYNPALLSDSALRRPSLSVARLLGGLTLTTTAYATDLGRLNGRVHFGLQYLGFGALAGADALGNPTGDFTANELVAYTGLATQLGRFTVGMNVKLAYATIAQTNSVGLGADVGARCDWGDGRTTLGLSLRNVGSQLSSYGLSGTTYSMPTTLELGLTQRLKYAPLRYHITLSDLHSWSQSAESDPTQQASFGEKLARRLTVALELLPSQSVVVALAYQHGRRVELRSRDQGFGLAGFSLGFGLRLKRLHVDYAWSGYHAAGGANQVGVSFLLPRRAS